MPYINVKITDENVTREQKQAIIKGCTQIMVDVLDKDPQVTFVVIDEVKLDDWGIGFDQVSKLREDSAQ
jgi:4-oxalocrotonate tautomerase